MDFLCCDVKIIPTVFKVEFSIWFLFSGDIILIKNSFYLKTGRNVE